MNKVRVIGSYLSPYVRKVLAFLQLKGVAYEIDPITPFNGDEEFSRMSPLRRIPVLIDGDLALADSSVICQYVEDRVPAPALFPRDLADRARARWFEEYADSRMGDVFIWQYWYPLVVRRFVFGVKPDAEAIENTVRVDIPEVLDYLERSLPPRGCFFGEISIADVSVAALFRNLELGRYKLDEARWPRLAAFLARMNAEECLASLRPFEEILLKVPAVPEQQREALAKLGAPVTEKSIGAAPPRPGIMKLWSY
jgi:glutathione S-transferase